MDATGIYDFEESLCEMQQTGCSDWVKDPNLAEEFASFLQEQGVSFKQVVNTEWGYQATFTLFEKEVRKCAHSSACNRPYSSRGLCAKHYQQARNNGTLTHYPRINGKK